MNDLTLPKKNLGFQEIEFGEKLSYSPISRFKGKKDKREMVQLMSLKPLAVRYHFEKGVGFYYCFGGSCCERGGQANIRYVFPIVVFDTDSKGRVVSKNFEIQYFQLGAEAYENLVLKGEVNSDLAKRMILVSCNDEKYQRLSMEVAGESPLLTDPEWNKTVMETYEGLRGHIPSSIARIVSSEAEFQALLKKANNEITPDEVKEFDSKSRDSGRRIIDATAEIISQPAGVKEAVNFMEELENL